MSRSYRRFAHPPFYSDLRIAFYARQQAVDFCLKIFSAESAGSIPELNFLPAKKPLGVYSLPLSIYWNLRVGAKMRFDLWGSVICGQNL
jgi:hypothetical protein